MLRDLLAVLGARAGRPLRRALAWMVLDAVLQGVVYLLLVPLLRALLGPHPADGWVWVGVLGGAVLVFAAVRRTSQLAGYRAGAGLSRSLHHLLGDQLARLPIGWFTPERVGEVSVLTSRGVLGVMSVPAHVAQPLVDAAVVPATVAVGLLFVDWRLGLLALLCGLLVALVQRRGGAAVRRADEARAAGNAVAAERVVEFIRAQPILRVGAADGGEARLDAALHAQREAGRRTALAALPGAFGLSLSVQTGFTALLGLGVWLALTDRLDVPALIVVLALAARSVEPLFALTDLDGSIQVARGALGRMRAVLAEPPLPEPEPGTAAVPSGHDIEFEDVAVSDGDRPVLRGMRLHAPAGWVTALVGPSGAGKSTALRLIMRFLDPEAGAVRIGGADLRELGTEQIIPLISAVFQDTYLFQGTIEENVRLGRPGATTAELHAAAAAARLDEMVERLPEGWRTEVGEGGLALSGGERQRVAIARALLKNAPIVLLDEATAALDAENEAAVRDGVAALMSGRTVVVVAHRLETVASADLIAFVEDGRVVESGVHEELLERDGRYAEFWSVAREAARWRVVGR